MESNYNLNGLMFDELSKEVDEIWNKLQGDKKFRNFAMDQGVEVDKLQNKQREQAFVIKPDREASGLDGPIIEIVIEFAPVFADIASDLWDIVFLPILIKKFGEGRITPKNNDQ